jgi:hypothetical protein
MMATSSASRILHRVQLASTRLAQLADAIAIELRRLNRARIDQSAFSTMAPTARRRAVKAALTAHHSEKPRCC